MKGNVTRLLNESEKNRIISMHKGASNKKLISETQRLSELFGFKVRLNEDVTIKQSETTSMANNLANFTTAALAYTVNGQVPTLIANMKTAYDSYSSLFDSYGLKFSIVDNEIAKKALFLKQGILPPLYKKDTRIEKLIKQGETQKALGLFIKKNNEIDTRGFKVNVVVEGKVQIPMAGDKVLTWGNVTPNTITNDGQYGLSSSFNDVMLFCNNAALSYDVLLWDNVAGSEIDAGFNVGSVLMRSADDKVRVASLELNKDKKYNGKISLDLDLTYPYNYCSTSNFTPGSVSAPVTGQIKPVAVTNTSFSIDNLGDQFDAGSIVMKEASKTAIIQELKTFLEKYNIDSYTIISSASGDELVDGASGYPAGTAPGTYTVEKPYKVKDTDTSGNAKLSRGRAQAIAAVFAEAGVTATPTMDLRISDGKEKARFNKAVVNFTPKESGTPVDMNTVVSSFTEGGFGQLPAGTINLIDFIA
jgi:outer membrane protein OmpA-like peptidoglycan-associated protein